MLLWGNQGEAQRLLQFLHEELPYRQYSEQKQDCLSQKPPVRAVRKGAFKRQRHKNLVEVKSFKHNLRDGIEWLQTIRG